MVLLRHSFPASAPLSAAALSWAWNVVMVLFASRASAAFAGKTQSTLLLLGDVDGTGLQVTVAEMLTDALTAGPMR